MSRKRRLLHLTFLLILLAVSVFIDLLHNEKGIGSNASCPACTFHLISIADSTIFYLTLAMPVMNGLVELLPELRYESVICFAPAARSPPGV